jgi:tetratricopeptide (TPR) repeat protein/DNA-binding MarR family transcriptional regulator
VGTPFISRFTPSLMAPETLEALLVQREPLVEEIMQGIRRSATTKAKHHVLLIAPRGLGKTHLVCLIYNRVKSEKKLQSRLRVAWLREEERGVTTFLELLVRILTALAREYADAGLQEELQRLYDLPRKESEHAGATLLTEYLGKRTLLLLIENLDAIFAGLKEPGQKALRAYLQEHPVCTTVATATSLFGGVSLQKSVFYGFFSPHHLEELTVDEAVALLARIAEVREDTELAEFVRTPTGRARVRAVHHIAGGNHRIYVVFSEFLSRSSLDELVDPFMRMLDDLTPYYQGRMDLLSPQQQQVVEFLTHAQGAQTVKEISRRCFVSQQTAASQLRDLKQKGYVVGTTPQSDKRETYYELREPLMRLCFEVKEYRGGPIRLFVDFLRHWYSRDELQERLEHAPAGAELELACLRHALELASATSGDARVTACLDDLARFRHAGDWSQVAVVAEEIAELRGSADDLGLHAMSLAMAGDLSRASSVLEGALATDPHAVVVQLARATVLMLSGTPDEAFPIFESLANSVDAEGEFDRLLLAGLFLMFGRRYDDALAAAGRCTALHPSSAFAWSIVGRSAQRLGRHAEALEAHTKAVALDGTMDPSLVGRFEALMALHRYEEALRALDDIPVGQQRTYGLFSARAEALLALSRFEDAVTAYDQAIAAEGPSVVTSVRRGLALLGAARLSEAFAPISAVLDMDHEAASSLVADAIVISIASLRAARVTAAARSDWLRRWQKLGAGRDEVRAPIALLKVAVGYLNTGDDRALLQLPVEARKLVMSLLGMEQDAEAEPGSSG